MDEDVKDISRSISPPAVTSQKPDRHELNEVIIHPLSDHAAEQPAGQECCSLYDSATSDQSMLRQADDIWLSSTEMQQLLELHVLPQLSFRDLCRLSMVSWVWRSFMNEHLTHIWRQAAYRENKLPPDLSLDNIAKLDQGSVKGLKDFMLCWEKKEKELQDEHQRAVLARQASEQAAAGIANQNAGGHVQQQARQQNPSRAFMCFWLAVSMGLNVIVWSIVAIRG